MGDYTIAVFDIGKTNKKLLLYDSDLKCLTPGEEGVAIPQIVSGSILCDDAGAIYSWMMGALSAAAAAYRDIRCISITTHGATLALLGREADAVFEGDGGLVFPVVSYEHEIPACDDQAFYEAAGESPERLQELTGTCRLGHLLNAARQVFWLRRRFGERFSRATDVLMWPQYFGYLLTGEKAAEPTCLGCHGYLLDIIGRKYSIVADAVGITDKLPPLPLRKSWEVLGTLKGDIARRTGIAPGAVVTVGAHDSNAALVPYFVKGFKNFVVQDSGTWVVSMSPREEASFEKGETGREVFFNRSIYGGPVKTTIFRGGAEFEFYGKRVFTGWPHPDRVDRKVLARIARAREAFAVPGLDRGSGLFPESISRLEGLDTVFRDKTHAWSVVDLSLGVEGHYAAQLAGGKGTETIFIEGNMARHNPIYTGVIATLSRGVRTFLGDAGGAAFGAALMGAAAVEQKRPEQLGERFSLRPAQVEPLHDMAEDIDAYAQALLDRLGVRLP